MVNVIITGWQAGFKKIGMTQLIRACTGYGLAEGKQCVDDILDEKKVVLEKLTGEQARNFVSEAQELGAVCCVQADETAFAIRG